MCRSSTTEPVCWVASPFGGSRRAHRPPRFPSFYVLLSVISNVGDPSSNSWWVVDKKEISCFSFTLEQTCAVPVNGQNFSLSADGKTAYQPHGDRLRAFDTESGLEPTEPPVEFKDGLRRALTFDSTLMTANEGGRMTWNDDICGHAMRQHDSWLGLSGPGWLQCKGLHVFERSTKRWSTLQNADCIQTFVPNGDGFVAIQSAETGGPWTLLESRDGHSVHRTIELGWVHPESLALSPNGEKAVVLSYNGLVRVIDLAAP